MLKRILLGGVFLSAVMAIVALAGNGPPAQDAIWADDMLYRTVDTGNRLPDHGPKDGLYVFDNLDGQRAVAESKPGDQDYNGGRWQVYVLEFTEEGLDVHDPDGDGIANFELTSWEQVEEHIGLGHLEQVMMGPSFTCPLIP
jgi:hypothetical protein